MTDQKIQLYQPTSQLMNAQSQSAIMDLANRLMKFPPTNKPLTSIQAAQLAVFSIMVDANPYAGEIYASDIGPQLGIPLYRRKAKEWNRAMGGNDDWDYSVNYRVAEDHEADFNPAKGDVAWVCELTDTKAMKEWQDSYVRFFNLATSGGASYKEADQLATRMSGPRPVWTGTGVVYGSEHFSKGEVERWEKVDGRNLPVLKVDETGAPVYQPEMFDRNERAKKRAEKVALKKRYPDLIIPEFSEVQSPEFRVLIENAEGQLVEAEEIVKNRSSKEWHNVARQAADDLGLDPDEIVGPEIIEEGEYTDADTDEPDLIYATVTDSKDIPYAKKELKDLTFSYNGLKKMLAEFGEVTDENAGRYSQIKLKAEACEYYINQKKEQANG
jgi:hypothetical protein